jgi:hemerythrin-like domain-containing protein
MKATELLQKQHRDVEALLERLHAAGQGDEDRIRHELAAALVAHTVIEEELFYPAVRSMLPVETLEALEEHGLADVQLARLLASGTGDETFEAKSAVLAEIVVRHIRREESEILKMAERELGDEHLNDLGERMGARFRHVIEAGFHKHLQKALLQELPGTPSRARRAAPKKTARRAALKKTAKTARRAPAAAAKKAKAPRRETAKAHAAPRRAPTKRAGAKRTALDRKPATTRKAVEKPARAARARRASTRAARSRA